MLFQECCRAVFWARYCSFCRLRSFFTFWKIKLIGYADDSTLKSFVSSPGIRVTAAESLILDLGRVSEWCDLWGEKLNASKTKTMIVMHPQSPPLTICGTVLKESDEIVILGMKLDSKLTFEKLFRFVSRAASQRLGILRKSWPVFHDRSLLERCFPGFCPALFGVLFCSVVLGCRYTP